MAKSAILLRYLEGVELVTRSLAGLSDAETDFTPAPGKWSVRQIAAHIADTELVSAYRFRLIISEENPAIIPFDQEAWAQGLNYAQRPPAESLADFRFLRLGTCDLLRQLPETVLERAGTHAVNGRMTLAQMIEAFAKHAESHARQIDAARAAYRTSAAIKPGVTLILLCRNIPHYRLPSVCFSDLAQAWSRRASTLPWRKTSSAIWTRSFSK